MGRAKRKIEKKKKAAAQTKSGSATVAQNRKAKFDFKLSKEIIAGLVLEGSEVKSLRSGNVQLKGAFAKIIKGEAWLFNCHIAHYEHANRFNHEPDRPKKLLLNRYEIERIEHELKTTNKTIVATKVFFKGNFAKASLSLAEGKKKGDKRDSLKKRSIELDIKRATSRY